MHARVFVGTRHTSALCYLCVCSPCPPPWLFVCSTQRNKKGGCAVKSSCHGCPALHRRAGPLAALDNHSLAEGHFFFPPLGWWRGPGGWRRGTA